MKISDLRLPTDWYPQARQLKRNIILHVGPTNSGKTFSALECLRKAPTGIYAGPLRLLAHEVYERLNTDGSACNLLTGEERRIIDGVEKWSCTVELTPLDKEFDVAVVDEIQMIGDEQRGWAWTQALLGIRAKEIHLCGEATVLPLVARICELTGDTMTVNKYERLTKLSIEKRGFSGSFSNIKPGDCVVTFSRKNIFALRKKIESFGNVKCAVIYGGLPPEVRSEQAKLFNSPTSGYDCLVASDAIGMGLNLSIRRVIFESLQKFDSKGISPLSIGQIKQIAGLGGRFRTQHNEGSVCTLHNIDMMRLRQALDVDSPFPLPSAGLCPTFEQIERFAQETPPGTTFSALLDKFEELARLDSNYFWCNLGQQKKAADVIEAFELSLADRYALVAAPSHPDDEYITNAFIHFAKAVSEGNEVNIADLVKLPTEPVAKSETLRHLESVHKVIVLYIWLSFRFPNTFPFIESASQMKQECETLITRSLDLLHNDKVIARLERRSYHKLKPLAMRAVDPATVLASKSRAGVTYSGLDVPEPARPQEELLALEGKEQRRKDRKQAFMAHNQDMKRQAGELREQKNKLRAVTRQRKEWDRRDEEIMQGVSKGGRGGNAEREDVFMKDGKSVAQRSSYGIETRADYSPKGSE
ncbi:P-loop containing nucleoside triphosphate hydrolase protein [Chytriomyces sp. MP71]|nr:P-loop containing nucleoside triphosphate hydrolase protein [Chytriomyces sp. MP71]